MHRSIRVFISSTFHDLQRERDVLVKQVFPQLRLLCEQREVAWTDVDLRWGITDEQSESADFLRVLLSEVDRCRPDFVAILGERYGSIASISQELLAEYPWLSRHEGTSITELEILYGALNGQSTETAHFYFRDPRYLDRLPAEESGRFRDSHPERQRRLAALKRRILEHPSTRPRSFSDSKELGQLVLADLTRVIEERFPPTELNDPLERCEVDCDGVRAGLFADECP